METVVPMNRSSAESTNPAESGTTEATQVLSPPIRSPLVEKKASFCWDCGKPSSLKCTICKTAFYCSKECQKTSWVYEHKIRCSADQELLKNIHDCYEHPKTPLVPRERILARLLWRWNLPYSGTGLANRFNLCWMNSALQCLLYTPPIGNTVVQMLHSRSCKNPKDCMYCEFEKFALACYLTPPGKYREAAYFASNLEKISSSLTLGRHEDAHEFFRHFIEALQACVLKQSPVKLPHNVAETSLIYQPFCGYLQSEVCCSSCGYGSKTYDPFLDLSLDFESESSLEGALRSFTSPQKLESNSYKCDKCKEKVNARRRLTIDTAPPILTIHLKRFNYYGGKVCRAISFPSQLNIQQYMSISKRSKEIKYNLYAVLIHAGQLASFGHYYCFAKRNPGPWICIDDTTIREVDEETVLNQKSGAYILFYCQEIPDPEAVKLEQLKNISIPRSKLTDHGMKPDDIRKKIQQVPQLLADSVTLNYKKVTEEAHLLYDIAVGIVECTLDINVEILGDNLLVTVYQQSLCIPLDQNIVRDAIRTQYCRVLGALRVWLPFRPRK